jgi:hypothetical protein
MILNLICLVFVVFSLSSLGCEIHIPSRILILTETTNLITASAHTECNPEKLKEINSTLTSVDGKITSFQLSGLLKNKNYDVRFEPKLIEIKHLKHIIREDLLLPPQVQLQELETSIDPGYIILEKNETVSINCEQCIYSFKQPINVKISNNDGSEKNFIFHAQFKKMVRALRLTSFLPAFSEVPENVLKEVFIEAIPHTDLVSDLSTLKFFKLNKPKRAGETLRQSDLSALSLVRAGMKTEIIIENALVKLKTSGISRSNGSIGEFVEIFNPQKNKKYLGKVIDLNKVLVEI